MARVAKIYNSPVEDVIRNMPDNQYDCVFTMAVLEHIHWESEWIFPEIARITAGFLVTIEEEERHDSYLFFPRNFEDVFESLGAKQVEEVNCEAIEGLSQCTARILKVP